MGIRPPGVPGGPMIRPRMAAGAPPMFRPPPLSFVPPPQQIPVPTPIEENQ